MDNANQMVELDFDDTVGFSSNTRGAIVRLSQNQTLTVSKALKPDTRTAAQLFELLGKLGQTVAADYGVHSVETFLSLWNKYAEIFDKCRFSVGQVADADNIFLFDRKNQQISDQQFSHRELKRRLHLAGLGKCLTKRMRKSNILDVLKISEDNPFLPPQPSHLVLLVLLEIATGVLPSRINSLVPTVEQTVDFAVEMTHGKYRSILRLDRLPSHAELEETKFALHSAGICEFANRSCVDVMSRLGGTPKTAEYFEYFLKHPVSLRTRDKRQFKDLVHALTGNFLLHHSSDSLHRKAFLLRDAPTIGNFFWSLEKTAAAIVAAECLDSRKFPIIPLTGLSVHEYLAADQTLTGNLLHVMRSEIFHHTNESVFCDLISVLDPPSLPPAPYVGSPAAALEEVQVPLVHWHPKKPRPASLPPGWNRLLWFLSSQTGVPEFHIHNDAMLLHCNKQKEPWPAANSPGECSS